MLDSQMVKRRHHYSKYRQAGQQSLSAFGTLPVGHTAVDDLISEHSQASQHRAEKRFVLMLDQGGSRATNT